jgi:hypothetical protein
MTRYNGLGQSILGKLAQRVSGVPTNPQAQPVVYYFDVLDIPTRTQTAFLTLRMDNHVKEGGARGDLRSMCGCC